MRIIDSINALDALKPNAYTTEEKVGWLSILDGIIKKEIIDTHKDGEEVSFSGYGEDTDLDTKLLADEPYTDLYVAWLESKVDYFNGELTKYNNSITRFNEMYSAYRNAYNRDHLPIGKRHSYY